MDALRDGEGVADFVVAFVTPAVAEVRTAEIGESVDVDLGAQRVARAQRDLAPRQLESQVVDAVGTGECDERAREPLIVGESAAASARVGQSSGAEGIARLFIV